MTLLRIFIWINCYLIEIHIRLTYSINSTKKPQLFFKYSVVKGEDIWKKTCGCKINIYNCSMQRWYIYTRLLLEIEELSVGEKVKLYVGYHASCFWCIDKRFFRQLFRFLSRIHAPWRVLQCSMHARSWDTNLDSSVWLARKGFG